MERDRAKWQGSAATFFCRFTDRQMAILPNVRRSLGVSVQNSFALFQSVLSQASKPASRFDDDRLRTSQSRTGIPPKSRKSPPQAETRKIAGSFPAREENWGMAGRQELLMRTKNWSFSSAWGGRIGQQVSRRGWHQSPTTLRVA